MALINNLTIGAVTRKALKLTINLDIGRVELNCEDEVTVNELGTTRKLPETVTLEGDAFRVWYAGGVNNATIEALAVKPLTDAGYPAASIAFDDSYLPQPPA